MPTKLEKPITITIEDHETALWFYHMANASFDEVKHVMRDENEGLFKAVRAGCDTAWNQIKGIFEDRNIDPRQEPPKPLKVGDYEAQFNPDGSVKVGCTTVTSEVFEQIVKKRAEVMAVKAEPEWPKWFYSENEGSGKLNLLRMDSETSGEWMDTRHSRTNEATCESFNIVQNQNYKPITPAQAAELLK